MSSSIGGGGGGSATSTKGGGGGGSQMNMRLLAKEFARDVIKQLNIPEADSPYMEAVLVEAALFEEPMKQLEISLNQVGPHYNVTIKGYENLIDLVRWVNTFMSVDRNPLLCHVTHTFVQTPPEKGALMVIQMNKMEFHRAHGGDLGGGGGGGSGGGGGGGGVKKFRKRTE